MSLNFNYMSADLPQKLSLKEIAESEFVTKEGWRLPDKWELLEIYEQLHSTGKEKFKEEFYWSSSETFDGLPEAVDFSDGRSYMDDPESKNWVRLVKDI